MRNMKRIYRRNRILVWGFFILLFLVATYFTLYHYQSSFFDGFFRDVSSEVQSFFKTRNIDYSGLSNSQLDSIKQENQELKELLELKTTLASYQMTSATIIFRDMDYWFQTVTIDKGENDGIQVDMAVVTEDGLIGRVIDTSKHSSRVKLITANDGQNKIAVSVRVNQNIFNGILQGYDYETDTLLVTSIRSNSDVQIGSIVETNGLGNLFPKGIYVGEVVDITQDDLGVSKVLKVKSKVSFENLRYVMVLERNEES